MANITIDFEYNLPDEYLHQTATKGLKAQWTYTGPAKIWIMVDNTTGQLEFSSGHHPDDGTPEFAAFMHIMAGQARKAILLDAATEPLIASIFVDRRGQTEFPQKEYKLPNDDTVYYSRAEPTLPDHTYEVSEIKYNLVSNEWIKPFPWKKPHTTMAQLEIARLGIIKGVADDLASADTPAEMKVKLQAFKAEMEAIPTKFAGWDAWQIPFPNDPRAVPVEVVISSNETP
jgi:hypothetical protein